MPTTFAIRFTLALTALAAVAASLAVAASARANADVLRGAGSSFVFPLVSQWAQAYPALTGVEITYSPIGSGGGIAAITNRTVDFAGSDAPLSEEQFDACKGCLQIPWALSATSVAYNLPGAKNNLRVTGPVLADIYMGKITRWNDARIASLNKGATLPSTPITPVHRSDNSGTTYNFTDYLSAVSGEWKSRLGKGVSVNWPSDVGTAARGSAGVAGVVSRVEGAICYVDVAYSLQNRLKFFSVQNRSGKFATPGLRGIKAAAESDIKPAASNELSIVNPPKKFPNAYPIATYTYVLVPARTEKAAQLRRFIFWALTGGQKYGPKLLFAPIPESVLVAAERTLKQIRS